MSNEKPKNQIPNIIQTEENKQKEIHERVAVAISEHLHEAPYSGLNSLVWYQARGISLQLASVAIAAMRDLHESSKQLPQIKPLVWKRIHRGYQVAECTISMFEVWENGGESGCWIAKCLDKKAVEVATEAEAKAWCEQEYERRVRECLE